MNFKFLLTTAIGYCCIFTSFAQTPTDLTSDVALTAPGQTDFAPSPVFSSKTQIEAAFNAGRRAEESQKGLPANSLGNLTLPSDWDSRSSAQRILWLVSQERQARTGQNYGGGAVLGKPLEAYSPGLNTIAQSHTDYLFANNLFTHTGSGGTTPYDRVNTVYPGCNETFARSENIYRSCGGGTNYLVEQAIFAWVYRDSGSAWGHRDAVLIQNISGNLSAPSLTTGYTDNYGTSGMEGFIGVGVKVGTGYTACIHPTFGDLGVRLVTMNILDPKPVSGSCTFSDITTAQAYPVRLLSFSAKAEDLRVKLGWKTSGESNSSHFVVQRSKDLGEYIDLGTVKSLGNTSETAFYGFEDNEPNLGLNYYRLKQVDFGGKFEYSKIIAASFGGPTENTVDLRLFPNPVPNNEYLKFKLYGMKMPKVQVFDLLGKEIQSKMSLSDAGDGQIIFSEKLPANTYIISLSEEGKKVSKLFVLN